MGKHEDLTGLHFGNLRVISFSGVNPRRQALWSVECACGKAAMVLASKLKQGRARSCGCLAANLSPEMVGRKFGRLTVVEADGLNGSRAKTWGCLCACGKYASVSGTKLRSGHTKSCGCLTADKVSNLNRTHSLSSIPEHVVWKGMMQRTTNPNHISYKNYGGRGIKVCERWGDFYNFICDMGTRPEGKFSIERSNNDGDYEPTNCYWADPYEQARNKRKRKDQVKLKA